MLMKVIKIPLRSTVRLTVLHLERKITEKKTKL